MSMDAGDVYQSEKDESDKMESWFKRKYSSGNQLESDQIRPEDSVSNVSRRSRSSRASSKSKQSSLGRSITSVRLEEERKRAELTARADALAEKRNIELAKLNLKLKEEELQIKTEIAVVDAQAKVLNKFENLEELHSQTVVKPTNSFTQDYEHHKLNQAITEDQRNACSYEYANQKGQSFSQQAVNYVDNSNITSHEFHSNNDYVKYQSPVTFSSLPPTSKHQNPVGGCDVNMSARAADGTGDGQVPGEPAGGYFGDGGLRERMDTGYQVGHSLYVPSTGKPFDPNASPFVPYSVGGTQQQPLVSGSNSLPRGVENAFLSVMRQIKKPATDIKKFEGNPLEFKRFMRQFTTRIIDLTESDEERMSYLDQYTVGEANRIVAGYGYVDAEIGYPAAIQELTERYGNEDILADAFVKKALNWSYGKPNDPKALDSYAVFLAECNNALKGIPAVKVLEYPENLRQIVQKLPYNLHDKWRNIVHVKRTNAEAIRFEHLVTFVKNESRKANDPMYGRQALTSPERSTSVGGGKPAPSGGKTMYQFKQRGSYAAVNNHTKVTPSQTTVGQGLSNQDTATVNKPCDYCNKQHNLDSCTEMLKIKYDERIKFLKSKGFCYACLKYGHLAKSCQQRATCSLCSGRHPRICHDDKWSPKKNGNADEAVGKKQATDTRVDKTASACAEKSNEKGDHTGAGDGDCTMAIIPVRIKLKNSLEAVTTYAFLDPGSSVCFCSEALRNELGATGPKLELKLSTMGNPYVLHTYTINGLQIYDMDMQNEVKLPRTFSKESMPVSHHHIPTVEDIQQWSHLSDVNLPQVVADIGLIIGNNVPDAYTPTDVRTGPKGSPHATRTALGWIVWNVVRDTDCQIDNTDIRYSVNRIGIESMKEIDSLAQLSTLVKKSINFDFPERNIDDRKEHSMEDERFLRKVEESMTFKNGRYEIGLPFRNKDAILPSNENQALSRLKGLEYKLRKDETFRQDYTTFMETILEKGYAEPVPLNKVERADSHVWYIPHHGVYHPRKPNKIRVVFDCSASSMGISLNDLLLPGPDMTNKLIGVLMRFRQEQVALVGDIEAMFFQVAVPVDDRDYLRFFWWPQGNLDSEPKRYRMKVHLFGAVSSPSCSNAALKQTALDNMADFEPHISQIMKKGFYVDDLVTSTATDLEAIEAIQGLSDMCLRGGFHLTKWISSSHSVMETIPKEERAKETKDLDLQHDDLPSERALGVYWLVEEDHLGFKIQLKPQPPTRRGILSSVSSVYDPLGLAAPVVLSAKILLQSLCKQGVGWDEVASDGDQKKWQQWVSELHLLEGLKIKRCYKPDGFGRVVSCQLHAFSDASDVGYGVAIYVRLVNDRNEVACSLVLGKARVAPLKKVTVPRMELTAATLAVRLTKMVRDELDYQTDEVHYWTDSMSVIRYVSNETTRYQTFVANRVTTIREACEPNQWHYVDTALNPADMASRGMRAHSFLKTTTWILGPNFLWDREDLWPKTEKSRALSSQDLELKKCVNATLTTLTPIGRLLNHCSSWMKLKILVGWLILVKDFLKKLSEKRKQIMTELKSSEEDKNKLERLISSKLENYKQRISMDYPRRNLSPDVLLEAEKVILAEEQAMHFPEEYSALKTDKCPLKKSSSLLKMDPVFKDGLIRVGGRLERSNLPYATKHPVILPKGSTVSVLILQDIHKNVGHMGRDAMLTELRKRFWLPGANTAVKTIARKCVLCRRYQQPVGQQKMADLPVNRVTPNETPFTRVGVDYYGPFECKRGRSLIKRYGVIFTCLATRAVHLEIAYSLSTSSYIHALRRFISRRGQVQVMLSDNGTNLVGAEKELKEEIARWNEDKIRKNMLQRNIKWEFNPPTGSHFGGVWERLIRSVRKVLFSLLKEQRIRLDDESLHTLMCEVEMILNGRPITRVSTDPFDLEPLSPNHLILQKSGSTLPPGIFSKTDNYAQRQWRQVQYLADQFWKRWTSDYLHLLQERQKWTKPSRNLRKDDVVLLVDSSPRNAWTLGRVIDTIKDKKGFVRMVQVKTKSNVLLRPIDKLCLLLESDS